MAEPAPETWCNGVIDVDHPKDFAFANKAKTSVKDGVIEYKIGSDIVGYRSLVTGQYSVESPLLEGDEAPATPPSSVAAPPRR